MTKEYLLIINQATCLNNLQQVLIKLYLNLRYTSQLLQSMLIKLLEYRSTITLS